METNDHRKVLKSILDYKNDFKNLVLKEYQSISDPDFIYFFLNFLRESSSFALKDDCSITNISGLSIKEGPQNVEGDQRRVSFHGLQKMSTPKVRDDIATPKSIKDFHTSSLNSTGIYHATLSGNKATPKYVSHAPFQQEQGKFTKSGQRHKTKPLSLSDFLSPEPGYAQAHSSSKKKSQRSRMQKGKRITPVAVEKRGTPFSADGSRLTRNEMSFSPHFEMSNKSSILSLRDAKSPVNPLYSEASRSISFDVEEEFPKLSNIPIQSSNCKPSRRIKPTTVAAELRSEVNEASPSVNKEIIESPCNPFMNAVQESPASGIDMNVERHLLLRMKNRGNDSNTEKRSSKTPVKSMEDISPVKRSTLYPDPSHIVEADRLKMLATLYSYFINMLMVPNIITELQFIIDLMTAISSMEKPDNSSAPSLCITGSLCNSSDSNIEESTDATSNMNLLSTATNCIFFAINTVQYLVSSGFISVLSRSTLSLLVQNYRIQHFLPSLSTQLSNLVEEIEQKEGDFSGDVLGSQEKLHSLSGVPFEADTDDRSNFPSDKSFHAFRKHRDMFYAILREYEERRNDLNFDIQNNLGGKIKNLVLQVKSTSTYKPFVRLFVSQMLQGANLCEVSTQMTNRSFARSSFNDSHTSKGDLLTSLRHGDPEKFRRLQSRFVTASTPSTQGNKMKDPLSEQCYFYKEFILTADSYSLNTHLCNELRERISDIENQQVQQIVDDASAETVNYASVSSTLSTLISSIRALGRLFGIVTFQPYDTGDCITPFDKQTLNNPASALENASSQNHEIITVPWVVEYLKSANFTTKPLIPEAEEIIKRLFMLYRDHAFNDRKELTTGDIMICLAISSLFEMSIFQDNYFYTLLKKYPTRESCHKSLKLSNVATQAVKQEGELESMSFDDCCSDLISFSLIYDWYPTLKEIKSTIISCNSGAGKSNQSQQPPRKIKPNTEKKSEDTVAQKKEKQLQQTLEEHFFRGQPSSLKRTVAFVAERCASNCVKHIRSVFMLKICDEAEQLFKQRIIDEKVDDVDNYAKVGLIKQVVNETKTLANVRMHNEAKEYCNQAVPQCMEDLRSCETADGVLQVATNIARKRAIASVYSWLSTRLDELVSVSGKARLTKVSSSIKKEEPMCLPELKSTEEDISNILPRITSISSLLHVMKEYTVKLMFKNSTISIDSSLPDQVSENEIMFVLSVSSALLQSNNVHSSIFSSDIESENFDRMQGLIKSSLHLRNSLYLCTRQLGTLVGVTFDENIDISANTQSVPTAVSNLQLTCS